MQSDSVYQGEGGEGSFVVSEEAIDENSERIADFVRGLQIFAVFIPGTVFPRLHCPPHPPPSSSAYTFPTT
jgi:hypothetical protein